MTFLDPPECKAARDAIRLGNALEAARILLDSKYPNHRCVRMLRHEVGTLLVAQAKEQFEKNLFEMAAETLDWADRCKALDGEALVLRQKVQETLRRRDEQLAEARRRREAQQARVRERLQEAKKKCDEGRFQDALDLLAELPADEPEVVERRDQVERRKRDFQYYIGCCREALEAGDVRAAYHHWQKARELAPEAPELRKLAQRIAEGRPESAAIFAKPLDNRAMRWVLDDAYLVVSTAEVCIGTPRDEGVHIPVQKAIHARHAVLTRDRHGWQIIPCRSRDGQPCPVWVNGEKIESACRLTNGCQVQLHRDGPTWKFVQSIAGSLTALLKLQPSCSRCIWVRGGRLLSDVILMDQQLCVRGNIDDPPPMGENGVAHLVWQDLPCTQLLFCWQDGHLVYHVEGGDGRLEIPGKTIDEVGTQLFVPCQLVIEPRCSEAERLGMTVAGRPVDPKVVNIAEA